jgi:hypothetical protein
MFNVDFLDLSATFNDRSRHHEASYHHYLYSSLVPLGDATTGERLRSIQRENKDRSLFTRLRNDPTFEPGNFSWG